MNSRILFCALSIASLAVSSAASAADDVGGVNYTAQSSPAEAPQVDDRPAEHVALHVAPAFFVPIGSLSDVTQMGIGALVGIDYRLSSRFVLTARGGYVTTASQDNTIAGLQVRSSVDFAPFLGGIKLYLAEINQGLFFAAEGGPVLAIASSHVMGQAANIPVGVAVSGTQTNFGGAASLGYETGRWDLRASLMTLDLNRAGNSTGLMATAAYAFSQF